MARPTLHPRAWGLVAGLVMLALGAAFMAQGHANARLARELDLVTRAERALQGWSRALQQLEDVIVAGQAMAPVERLLRGDAARRELPDLHDVPAGSRIAGPLRDPAGELALAVRVRGNGDGDWTYGLAGIDRLVAASGLAELPAAGLDYRLTLSRPPGPQAVAATREALPAGAVSREWSSGADRWTLAVAPRDPWRAWRTLAAQLVVVLALALAAALVAQDMAKERVAARLALGAHEARLAALRKALTDEIGQREVLEKQFSHASFHDALTGLPNRRHLVNQIRQQRREGSGEGDLALIVLELDRFDATADTIGTSLANHFLTNIARDLEKCLGEGWSMARLREAQFAFALTGAHGREPVLAMADRLNATLAGAFRLGGHVLFVRPQMGIAFAQSSYDHPDDLLRAAQIALARARESGQRVGEFAPSAAEQIINRHQLEVDLHNVAERGELLLHFQPIVALPTREIAGFEALVRWRHPREGMIPPGMFIPLAEDSGLITPITRWVLAEACRQAREWRDRLPDDRAFYLSVNLAGPDMRAPGMAEYIGGLLREAGLPRGTLRLELTEGSMIDDVNSAVELITRLRGEGAMILLDDFGTGYSSLSYLHRFQIDYLKIDQSFVGRITPDEASAGIVRAIMRLAEGLALRTVAEGIENAEAARQLAELGCDFGQGYYFSKPLPPDQAWPLLRDRKAWTS